MTLHVVTVLTRVSASSDVAIVRLEGQVVYLTSDDPQPKHSPRLPVSRPYLNVDGKLIPLALSDSLHAQAGLTSLRPGKRAAIDGSWKEGYFHVAALGAGTANSDESQPETVGEQKVLVAPLAIPGLPDGRYPLADFQTAIMTDSLSLDAWLRENSYGLAWLNAQFTDWVDLPHEVDYYQTSEAFYRIMTDAVELLDTRFDLTAFDHLILYVQDHPNRQVGASAFVGKVTLYAQNAGEFRCSVSVLSGSNPIPMMSLIRHEFGHQLGFHHAGLLNCLPSDFTDPMYPESEDCPECSCSISTLQEYGDQDDTMGGYYGHVSVIYKSKAGWLPPTAQVEVPPGPGGEYWVDQWELPSSGVKSLRIPLGTDPAGNLLDYFLEFRANAGMFTGRLPGEQVIVRTFLPSIQPYTLRINGSAYAGAVRGTVRPAFPWLFLYLVDKDGSSLTDRGAFTDVEGNYCFPAIPVGTYRVLAGRTSGLWWQYFQGLAPETLNTFLEATPVDVTSGAVSQPIDFDLPVTGIATGTVTDETGNPLSGATMVATRTDWVRSESTSTDDLGVYQIELPPGQYLLYATKPGYVAKYYPAASSPEEAQLISVQSQSSTAHLDFALSNAMASTAPRETPAGLATPTAYAESGLSLNHPEPFQAILPALPAHDPVRGVRIEILEVTGEGSGKRARVRVERSQLTFSAESLHLQKSSSLEPAAATLTVTNHSESPVYFEQVRLTGRDALSFAISSDSCSNGTLQVSASCSVTVQLIGSTAPNRLLARLQVPNNDRLRSKATIPVYTDENRTPVADAGLDQVVKENMLVMLDGSGSSDPNGDTLTYAWSQLIGTPVVLSDAASSTATFTAPMLSSGSENSLLFQLTVSDGFLAQSENVLVTVTPRTFVDVPATHLFYAFVEKIFARGITAGCSSGNYCIDAPVTRAQMAVFLEKGVRGSNFSPPAPVGLFQDVGTSHWAAAWIEQFSTDGITAGCGPLIYCPDAPVTRAQMAVFLLKAKCGSTYVPADPTGLFADVPTGHWAARWIEKLATDGITAGCAPSSYCPDNPVTRGQMAVFLSKTFGF